MLSYTLGRRNKMKILVIEDDKMLAESIKSQL